jgi:hypothetical protein
MTRNKQVRVIFALIMIVIMMLPSVALADTGKPGDKGPGKPPVDMHGPKVGATGPSVPPPIAITGPRVNPRVIPHTSVINPAAAYNWVAAGNVPQALEANAADGGKTQSAVGRGIKQTDTGVGTGITLYATPNVCANFNAHGQYKAVNNQSEIWTDWPTGCVLSPSTMASIRPRTLPSRWSVSLALATTTMTPRAQATAKKHL